MDSSHFTRRAFLGGAAASAGAAALAAPSDQIRFGLLGMGVRGNFHLDSIRERAEQENVGVAAVCDVFQRRLDRAAEKSGADGYLDYREVLARADVDAVVVATPDHWHARMALDALEAGKHVYLEKPMTLTAEEAIAVRDKVRDTGLVLQVGPQWTGDDAFWRARDAIRQGRIGKVTWAQSGITRNFRPEPFNGPPFTIDPSAGPDKTGDGYIHWDMWLGHEFGLAPKIPFEPDHFFRFRKYWAYSTGLAGDLLYHRLAPLLLALEGPDGAYPLRVMCGGGLYIDKDERDIADTMLMTVDYPNEYTVLLITTHTNDTQVPTRICGKFGTLDMNRDRYFTLGGEPMLSADGDYGEEFRQRNGGYAGVRLPNVPRRDMLNNFIDVIRGKGALYCNAELGAATMVAIAMGVDAYREHKVVAWDAAAEKVIG
jgi:predicted dehydrogenase